MSTSNESLEAKLKKIDKSDLLREARELLRGKEIDADSLKKYAKALAARELFAYASEIQLKRIKLLEDNGINIELSEYHKLVIYIYKDTSLPSGFRFEKALNWLNSKDSIDETNNCETLGLAGAIYKYRWYWDQKPVNLEKSLYYYSKGYELWVSWCNNNQGWVKNENETSPQNDFGYTAINYAYMLEVYGLNRLEILGNNSVVSNEAIQYFIKARDIREFILKTLLDYESTEERPLINNNRDNGWVLPTVIEALCGLRKYKAAKHLLPLYINESTSSTPENNTTRPLWEVRTFVRQILAIANLQQQLQKYKTKIYDLDSFIVGQEISETAMNDFLEQLIGKSNNSKNEKNDEDEDCCKENEDKVSTVEHNNETRNEEKKTTKNTTHPSERLGLALSGGGFRASLFHIGTLAALAEANRLKDLTVISCVSGGSIIGAYYYLKLKNLLENCSDKNIKQKCYINLVKEIENDFLKIVQKNIRMRLFSNLGANLKMVIGGFIRQTPTGAKPKGNFLQRIFSKKYLRTHRLAELYDIEFYRHLVKNRKESLKDKPLYMNELFIEPKGMKINDIEGDNLRRINKIPQLVLNATSLNTAHNWQFTASWMGEPAASIQQDIDVKPRLRRMYYRDAPEEYRNFPLGYAVAASSCVPGLFDPLPMYNLYPGIDLQLVDGGVHDNQGIGSLIEQECNRMIINDASGQMGENNESSVSPLSVLMVTDTIFQERIRELQFRDVIAREEAGTLAELKTTHLKSGLQRLPLNWLHCTDPPREIFGERCEDTANDLTEYGILKSVQQRLSEIRTDLDSFNNTEAYALMYSGYVQTRHELKMNGETVQEESADWNFMKIKNFVTVPDKAEKIIPLLNIGSKTLLKVFQFTPIKYLMILLSVLILTGLSFILYQYWNEILCLHFQIKTLAITILIFTIGLFVNWLGKLLGWKTYVFKKLLLTSVVTGMFFVSWFYLCLLNPFYNKKGEIK